MSASTWTGRGRVENATPGPARDAATKRVRDAVRGAGAPRERQWVGVDFSGVRDGRPARRLLPLLVFALIAALGVVALRIDLIRTRYAMAAVLAEENTLIEQQRGLIVRRRQLRDPVELAVLARERGFRPLAGVLTLPDPPALETLTALEAERPAVATARSTSGVPGSAGPVAPGRPGPRWR